MKNNINFLKNIDNTPFLNKIKLHLENNLNNYLISSLSNVLTIDYVNRLRAEPQIDKYAMKCVERLKNHLKHMVVTDESFSSTMSLFAIALTEEKNLDDESLKPEEKNQDVIIDSMLATQFGDLSPIEQKNIKEVLKNLLMGRDGKEIMNFINSDPKLFYSVIFSAHREKAKQKDFMTTITNNLNKIIADTKSINRKKNNIKSLVGKITMVIGLAAIASAGAVIGGLVLPALLIPAAAITINLGPVIGEQLGEIIAKNNNLITKKQSNIKTFLTSINQPELEQNISQSKFMEQKKHKLLQPEIEIRSQITNVLDPKRIKAIDKNNSRQR